MKFVLKQSLSHLAVTAPFTQGSLFYGNRSLTSSKNKLNQKHIGNGSAKDAQQGVTLPDVKEHYRKAGDKLGQKA